MATAAIKELVKKAIAENGVMIFSKTTCPYCRKAKSFFDSMRVAYNAMELDQRPDGKEIQNHLFELTQQKTVPNIFIHGTHVGGSSDLTELKESGEIYKLLSKEQSHSFDYDMIVIGGGSGGLACSREAAQFGKKVAVLDYVKPSPIGTKWGLGGTCVNVGCIPKKLMHSAGLVGEHIKDANEYGWQIPSSDANGDSDPMEAAMAMPMSVSVGAASFDQPAPVHKKNPFKHDWSTLINNVQAHIGSLNWGYRVALRDERVEYINAMGSLVDQHSVKVSFFDRRTNELKEEKVMTADKIVIAVGGRPKYLGIENDKELCVTSDDLFSLEKPPGKTLIVGASYIALECSGFLAHFGYDTTVMARSIFLRGYDQEMASKAVSYMENHGVKFVKGAVPIALEKMEDGKIKVEWKYSADNRVETNTFDTVMLAIGRDPITGPLNLDAVGVNYDRKSGKIPVNADDSTNIPNIYAVGDVVQDRLELTPVAIQTGKLLARRLFAGSAELLDHKMVPVTVYTPLEYGTIGYSEEDAIAKWGSDNIEVYHGYFKPLEWTVPHREDNACMCKLVCLKTEKERVVGLHYVGPNAGEVTQGYAVGMRLGATKHDFESTIAIHPTTSEEIIKLKISKSSGKDATVSGC
ncbi:thioredoxin reductase 3-like protein [Paraphysoderma sedebokerense]|nr:thioredoxin reductase 3-like protein [Paraphysoderma sedebokerense]